MRDDTRHVEVSGCWDCPFLSGAGEWGDPYRCGAPGREEDESALAAFRAADVVDWHVPDEIGRAGLTPEWCPLRRRPSLVVLRATSPA